MSFEVAPKDRMVFRVGYVFTGGRFPLINGKKGPYRGQHCFDSLVEAQGFIKQLDLRTKDECSIEMISTIWVNE